MRDRLNGSQGKTSCRYQRLIIENVVATVVAEIQQIIEPQQQKSK